MFYAVDIGCACDYKRKIIYIDSTTITLIHKGELIYFSYAIYIPPRAFNTTFISMIQCLYTAMPIEPQPSIYVSDDKNLPSPSFPALGLKICEVK